MIDLYPHTAFTEETPSVPRWMRGDDPADFAEFPHLLDAMSLDQLLADCEQVRARTPQIIGDLQTATDASRAVRTALGDED